MNFTRIYLTGKFSRHFPKKNTFIVISFHFEQVVSPLDVGCPSCQEYQLQVDKLSAKCDNVSSQNSLLNLSLEESKSTTDKLTVLLGKHESNVSAMQLAINYSDCMIEAYDVLVALLETSDKTRRRSAAEKVATHLLSTKRSDSGLGRSAEQTWDDSSGYSQATTSSTSTTSSIPGDYPTESPLTCKNVEEMRLRDHINQLKVVRASVQNTLVELEPVGCSPNPLPKVKTSKSTLEDAVSKHDLMAMREECADLRAKLYLADKECSTLQMSLEDRHSVESILRTHIEHLQDELERLNRGETALTSLSREDKLRQRVDSLLDTLNRVTRNSELRHKHADELVGDLKRANR